MKKLLLFPALLLLAGCGSVPKSEDPSDAQLQRDARQGAVVLDVRTPEEYATGHLTGSTNLPISELPQRITSVVPDKNSPVMVHCQSGGRSARAAKELRTLGYSNVTDLGSLAHARQVVESSP